MEKPKPRIPPALVLFFLSPVIGELLSGSAPPIEFFNPFSLLLLSALYGSGALLARELALRWGKRWPTIVTLGLAYGILEEGLMVKSFFDPTWMDLGVLGVYGRWVGVNWVWAVMLTLYHAVVSIGIPILLVELIFPGERDQPWLGQRGLRMVSVLLALDVVFGFTLLTTYRPPWLPYLLTMLAVLGLVLLARSLPVHFSASRPVAPWGTFRLGLAGFLGMTSLFLAGWVLPAIDVPAPLTIAIMLGSSIGVYRLLRFGTGEGVWSDRGRWALVSGALTFFILLAFLAGSDPNRVDNPTGMGWVGLAAAAGLCILGWRISRRAQNTSASASQAT